MNSKDQTNKNISVRFNSEVHGKIITTKHSWISWFGFDKNVVWDRVILEGWTFLGQTHSIPRFLALKYWKEKPGLKSVVKILVLAEKRNQAFSDHKRTS